jgi:hypothetical protein
MMDAAQASPRLRAVMGAAAAGNLVLLAGYATQQPWAVATWPFETGRLSYLFVASILAAIVAGATWIAVSGEAGSLPAGALTLTVITVGSAGSLTRLASQPAYGDLTAHTVGAGIMAAISVGLLVWGWRRFDTGGTRAEAADPLPPLVRISYVAFTLILVGVGGAMILQIPGVVPWPVDPGTSALIGWIFFGNAWYFAYAVLRPRWRHARAQLWSFLAYDVVLLRPLLGHLRDVPTEWVPNLVIYLAAVIYSALLAVVFLLVDPRTRVVGQRHELGTSGGQR